MPRSHDLRGTLRPLWASVPIFDLRGRDSFRVSTWHWPVRVYVYSRVFARECVCVRVCVRVHAAETMGGGDRGTRRGLG